MRIAGIVLMVLVLTVCSVPRCGAEFVRIQGDQFRLGGQVVKLKGTNYYPKNHPWADMWNSWDWWEMVTEVGMIRNLGMNCVRILVPYTHGGWGGPNPPADRLQKLEDLVNLFGDNGIRSCVTLFDWETTFPAAGTSKEREHLSYLSAIVNRLKNNESVLMWDVKNEPDHPDNIGGYDNWDYNPTKRNQIVSWLQRMCNAVRAIDPNHPVSVGIRWWENVNDVINFVDVAMFHSYWPNVTQQITTIKSYMGSNQKPIVCEEFGWPTNPYPCYRDGHTIWDYTETKQLEVYTNHMTAFIAQNIAGCMQWWTFDTKAYTSNPSEDFGHYFGLWRYDYSLKPAGAYYRDNFPVTQFPPQDRPPGPVTNFMATPMETGISLSWVNPSDPDFVGTMIRFSTTGYPSDPNSGTLVCNRTAAPGSSDAFVHANLQPGVTYYYSAFAYDQALQYSTAARTSGSPSSQPKIGMIRQWPDGTQVSLAMMPVTAVFSEEGCIYIEERDRTAGIRVVCSTAGLAPGDLVNVSGKVNTLVISGQRSERQITNATVNKVGSGVVIKPVAMNCRAVGGKTTGLVPGVVGGVGQNNIGLLVKIAGRVTRRIGNYLWVDDGSRIQDIDDRIGVMVRCFFDPGKQQGDFVSCVGVVTGSIPIGWTANRRAIFARSPSDVVSY